MRMLARLNPITKDAFLSLQGKSMDSVSPEVWRRQVQYVSQHPVFFQGSLEDNLLMPWQFRWARQESVPGLDLLQKEMDMLGLSHLTLNQSVGPCSGGEKMRLALIRALLLDPMVLLCDEVLAPLDQKNRTRVLNRLDQWLNPDLKRCVLFSGHDGLAIDFPEEQVLILGLET